MNQFASRRPAGYDRKVVHLSDRVLKLEERVNKTLPHVLANLATKAELNAAVGTLRAEIKDVEVGMLRTRTTLLVSMFAGLVALLAVFLTLYGQINDRFERMQEQTNQRFERMDQRFDQMNRRLDQLQNLILQTRTGYPVPAAKEADVP